MQSLDSVRAALKKIVSDHDYSVATAAALETAIASGFAEDGRFDDLVQILASYRPSGGEFLFDAAALKAESERVLKLIQK